MGCNQCLQPCRVWDNLTVVVTCTPLIPQPICGHNYVLTLHAASSCRAERATEMRSVECQWRRACKCGSALEAYESGNRNMENVRLELSHEQDTSHRNVTCEDGCFCGSVDASSSRDFLPEVPLEPQLC